MLLKPASSLLAAAVLWGSGAGVAHAGPTTTQDALDRLEELLEIRVEDGSLSREAVLPAILVSALPRYEASAAWYVTSAIEALEGALGSGGLRLCEACMAPRISVQSGGSLVYQAGPVGLGEVIRLDEATRGSAPPARSAIWLDETLGGISVRIIDLRSGRVLFAQNVDPGLVEGANTARIHTLSEELERRARGDSLTQAFADFALYPGQHISVDWTDQWGPSNDNLSGVTLSAFDPVLGLGASHYRALDFYDILVGGKLIFSLPTAVVKSVGRSGGDVGDFGDVIDPLLTAVAVARVPFGRSNYGGVLAISTNGQVGLGLSLMNVTLLPVIP